MILSGTGMVFSKSDGLVLTFDSIANTPVANPYSVSDWNTFFNLPTFGTRFNNVIVDTNVSSGVDINLQGGSNIILKSGIFLNNIHLKKIVDSKSVTSIGGAVNFNGCSSLTTAIFPRVISMGGNVFQNVTTLTEIGFPLLQTMGNACFVGCTGLTSVSMPELLTAGQQAFNGCSSVTSYNLPKLTVVDSYFVYGNSALTSISLPSLTTAANYSFSNCALLTSVSLPSLTTITSNYCFLNSKITSFYLPSLVSFTGTSVFQGCNQATIFDFPLCTTVGPGAFANCTSVTTINLPSCTDLGGSVLNNSVFLGITGKTIGLKVPASLLTCNSGNPDGDIQYLQANNTVIIKNGSSSASAGDSAYQIKTDYPSSTDGLYWIKNSNINGGSAFQIYADMTTDGGGWTLILLNNYSNWNYAGALLRNQLTPPSSPNDRPRQGDGADGSDNYSIVGWADYIKKSPSGFQYMIDAYQRGHWGAIWTANGTYSFVNTDNTQTDITINTKFDTWDYTDTGVEQHMPWYSNNCGVLTTSANPGDQWWGTLISQCGWFPVPWMSAEMPDPGIIWYWVR